MKEKRIAKVFEKFEKLAQMEARKLAREMEGYFEFLEFGF